jgi:predicted membrane protein
MSIFFGCLIIYCLFFDPKDYSEIVMAIEIARTLTSLSGSWGLSTILLFLISGKRIQFKVLF